MSYVTWQTPTDSAHLAGPEYHQAHFLVAEQAGAVLDVDRFADRLHALLPDGHYLRHYRPFRDSYRTAFAIAEDLMVYAGRVVSVFDMRLNTAMAHTRDDAMRLLVRLAAQADIHCWVEGPDRAWLAEIITRGRASGLLREGMGWDAPTHRASRSVVDLLRAEERQPVVLSYSVTGGFPAPEVGDWMPPWPAGVPRHWDALSPQQQQQREARLDQWELLEEDEQWRISMAGLRDKPALRLCPQRWDVRFGHGLSLDDLQADDYEQRFRSALGMEV